MEDIRRVIGDGYFLHATLVFLEFGTDSGMGSRAGKRQDVAFLKHSAPRSRAGLAMEEFVK